MFKKCNFILCPYHISTVIRYTVQLYDVMFRNLNNMFAVSGTTQKKLKSKQGFMSDQDPNFSYKTHYKLLRDVLFQDIKDKNLSE